MNVRRVFTHTLLRLVDESNNPVVRGRYRETQHSRAGHRRVPRRRVTRSTVEGCNKYVVDGYNKHVAADSLLSVAAQRCIHSL